MRPVFVHVSKNGGTSIVGSAGDQIVNAGHRTASSWVAEHGDDAPLFAVVRHPYDRVASEYAYRRRRLLGCEQNPHLDGAAEPFEDWVVATFVEGRFRTAAFFEHTGQPFNSFNMVDGNLIWFVPQTRWLGDADGHRLVEEVVRFERLDADWADFCERHAIDAPLHHANASPGSADVRAAIDDRVKAIIHDHYRSDFEAFGYAP
ncbi:MAG: sulfotransferase family 2 domain-containing protein [Actinomycetota bacterium]